MRCAVMVQIDNICVDNGFAPNTRQTIIWTNDGLVYLNIFGPSLPTHFWSFWSFGLDELTIPSSSSFIWL